MWPRYNSAQMNELNQTQTEPKLEIKVPMKLESVRNQPSQTQSNTVKHSQSEKSGAPNPKRRTHVAVVVS
jgi:hypothetical protein